MTSMLKDVLTERAGTHDAPDLDLDAIVRAGDQRIRRRRAVGGLAVAALTAAVVATGLTVIDRPAADGSGFAGQTTPTPAPPPLRFAEDRPTWADATTIHYGTDTIDLRPGPEKLEAFVKTDAGFAYVSPQGDVVVTDGVAFEKVGRGNEHKSLSADDTGTLVGWIEQKAVPEAVVYDVQYRRVVLRTSVTETSATDGGAALRVSSVAGIDEGYVYFGTSDEKVVRRDLTTGRSELVPGVTSSRIRDIADGWYAVNRPGDEKVVASRNPTPTSPAFAGFRADLSPTGRYLATEYSDVSRFFDLQTATPMVVEHPDYPVIFVTQWLDDDEFVALGSREDGDTPADLLTCSVGDGDCTVTIPALARFDGDDDSVPYRFPTGRSYTDS